ncbi:hypothetical protein NDU88_002823 [Pleurodeles waltl]|uniref:Uncharacterized protein n=1 Tax=Pleurodeles waltl TaxID=8319 RepID=A0AAV7P7V8_PLEWA|nr:hypothetical protein NDU88_002823 [Pleurodeles waltl]
MSTSADVVFWEISVQEVEGVIVNVGSSNHSVQMSPENISINISEVEGRDQDDGRAAASLRNARAQTREILSLPAAPEPPLAPCDAAIRCGAPRDVVKRPPLPEIRRDRADCGAAEGPATSALWRTRWGEGAETRDPTGVVGNARAA